MMAEETRMLALVNGHKISLLYARKEGNDIHLIELGSVATYQDHVAPWIDFNDLRLRHGGCRNFWRGGVMEGGWREQMQTSRGTAKVTKPS